ncbi:hypothetical protein [Anaerosacchariphilus polymeriproducens]|uniref:Uncharacterized protein n=1 Tax=Anaerosacchariphilus polymeriproducens TaxID=1812858 RepID=A0A371B050_9FIRM|nr:hypothetical protein [Anaerosacchariphilus polymeriproducens]RDU25248.1 hypothetical protein DWV06_00120 [Anaerosacchariphilus polymeriproducens]
MKEIENQLELSQKNFETILQKNHLEKEDYMEELADIYSEMKKRLELEISCERVDLTGYTVLTLGAEIDNLQQEYMQKDELMKAYLLDALAQELIEEAYEKVKDYFLKEKQFYLKQFLFPGAQIPMEEIKNIFQICKPKKISYNDVYMLKPLKSVAFLIELVMEQPSCEYNMCNQCSNKACAFAENKDCIKE